MKDKIEFIIVQFNAVVGDLEGNTNRIIDTISKNRSLNSTKVFVFPELALCGYSPEDLLLRHDFKNAISESINKIRSYVENNEYLIFGSPYYSDDTNKIWNSAYIINNKTIKHMGKNNLCVTVAKGKSKKGGGGTPPHLMRHLIIDDCQEVENQYNTWQMIN